VKITKRQLRRIIREEKARLSRQKLLNEAMTFDDVMSEVTDMNDIAGKLLSALETGGIETPGMGGLEPDQAEFLQMTMENIRYELAQLGSNLK